MEDNYIMRWELLKRPFHIIKTKKTSNIYSQMDLYKAYDQEVGSFSNSF